MLARLGKPGANAYFFDRLDNPAWIKPLYERGFFKRPPEPDRRDDGVSFPDWPELRYLKRMATVVPEVVGPIVENIPDTDNARVRQLQIEIGATLGRVPSQKLGDRAVTWLDDAITLHHFAEPFAQFVVHLFEVGERKRAIRLGRKLLASDEGDGTRRSKRLDEWHYERYLKLCLPALKQHAPVPTLEMLRDLLLDSTREPLEGQTDDYSYIWRRDLLHANHSHKEISDILIDALRDTAIELARCDGVGFDLVRRTLLGRNRRILTRIVLYTAAEVCEPNDPFVLTMLLDTQLVDRHTCRAEYTLLLQRMFLGLSEHDRESVLQAMDRDPLQSIALERQQELTPERLSYLTRSILRDRLMAFGDALPSALVSRRDQLISELGQPRLPPLASAVWSGPTSPLTRDDLEALSPAAVVDYLKIWLPTREFSAPTREGLGRQLQQLVKERAQDWAREARSLVGLNPTYVRGFVQGLTDACAAKVTIEWEAVLELLQWVIAQPRELAVGGNPLDEGEDPDWSWTRQSIARLLETALRTKEAELPWSLRGTLCPILHDLLRDPDPPVDSDPIEDRDPLTTSLNCVRGMAAHALFRFAWWIHEHVGAAEVGARLSFHRMPEVKVDLELILGDASPAVRTVLGDWFRTLYFFDPSWTAQNIDSIFPESSRLKAYWLATWRAFVDYDHPYDPAFGLLKHKYELALDRLEGAADEERKRMGETGLGQHLASYYWRGVAGEESRSLLLRYFERCSPAAAAQVLWSLGRGLQGSEPISPAILSALANLWAALDAQSLVWPGLKRREVYRQFGQWFISARFESQWSLRGLKRAVEIGAGMPDLEGVLERLHTLCAEYPLEVSEILELLLVDERQHWQPLLWKTQIEGVLLALLTSANPTARGRAETIVNQLVENGNLFAREILIAVSRARSSPPTSG